MVTQSGWRSPWPPHSSFSSVLASLLRLPPSAVPASPFLNPHKTLLAGLYLSLSHPSPPPHLWPESQPKAQLRPFFPFHKAALGQDRFPGLLGSPSHILGASFPEVEAKPIILGSPLSILGVLLAQALENWCTGLGDGGREGRKGKSHSPCWQLPNSPVLPAS